MDSMREYTTERRELSGVPCDVVTYRIGDRYYCHISNVDPGATIARSEGASRKEAEDSALLKTTNRLVK